MLVAPEHLHEQRELVRPKLVRPLTGRNLWIVMRKTAPTLTLALALTLTLTLTLRPSLSNPSPNPKSPNPIPKPNSHRGTEPGRTNRTAQPLNKKRPQRPDLG